MKDINLTNIFGATTEDRFPLIILSKKSNRRFFVGHANFKKSYFKTFSTL